MVLVDQPKSSWSPGVVTHSRAFVRQRSLMSALPPESGRVPDTGGRLESAISRHSVIHSITSSARASSVGGTLRPSALAVFRLITSSNFVGPWTGRSAGFSPLRMRSM